MHRGAAAAGANKLPLSSLLFLTLCPIKVPTQSPVAPSRSMGWPSWEADVRK